MKLKSAFFAFVLVFTLVSCQQDKGPNNQDTQTDKPEDTFDIVFNAGEGGGAAPAALQVLPNGTITLPGIGTMTAPGSKQFAGWEIDNWFYREDREFTVTKNMTFTAVWMAPPSTRAYPSIRYVPASNPNSTAAHVLGLWLPDSGAGPFPVVIYVTGGAFQSSSNGQPPGYYTQARAKGYAVASIQHRVNSTANNGGKFPNQTLDVLAAIRFLRANAAAYNLDPNRFIITGHSAGGYQSNMVAVLSNSPDGLSILDPDNVLDTLGNPGVSINVLAAISWAGLSDFRKLAEQHRASGITPAFPHDTATAPGTVMLNVKNETVTGLYDPKLDDAYERSNPINYVHEDMPPIILQCSRDDSTVPYQTSVILSDKIAGECGADRVKLYIFNGQNHNTLENVTLSAEQGGGSNMAMILNFIESGLKL